MAITFQIIGHKKSGKTTLLQEFLRESSQYKISVAKHTHLPIDIPTTNDTGKFFQYSDDVLLLNDEQTIHYQRKLPTTELEKIEELQRGSSDFIIIEGIKELDFPKIALLKSDESPDTFADVTNIKYFVTIQGNRSDNVIDIENLNTRKIFINKFLRDIEND
ncbi:molybdopterin-guanine dinucleotide biosynthesis protein MobB [Companilactobacillus jidongensis]|uniref:molybdopterin-guanine dinucleotide biosynthesis protein MobB n=1 Tax=Companilactobacillus jidongensis TaxID=2486006 RepID=UPI000F7A0D8C|nr:molybdopterin-guanine dinucleotide biosynthesis protein MobB [Companilactobacillus jidongensis]